MSHRILSVVVLIAAGQAAVAQDVNNPAALEKKVQQSIARADPAVASVLVSRRSPPQSFQELIAADGVPEYIGCGVVIDHRLVLTCYHVVRDATRIAVRLPGIADASGQLGRPRVSEAEIYAADSRCDLAVLLLSNQKIETPPIVLGKGENLKKGTFVIGLSRPFAPGFHDTGANATWGLVGNLRRRSSGRFTEHDRSQGRPWYGTLTTFDARLGFGLSGAAIVDKEGKLVGVTTAQAALPGSAEAGCFAVPIDSAVRRVIEVLRKGEEVEYGFLGISSEDGNRFGPFNNPFRGSGRTGVTITAVSRDGPAYRAKLRVGDNIIAINGQPVQDFDDVSYQIAYTLAGREIAIEVIRTGSPAPLTARTTLAKWSNPDPGIAKNRPADVHGLRVDYTSVLAQGSNEPIPPGVIVRDVIKGSPADYAKLGDFRGTITAVNGVTVLNPAEFYRESEKATRAGRPVQLTLNGPERLSVTLQ